MSSKDIALDQGLNQLPASCGKAIINESACAGIPDQGVHAHMSATHSSGQGARIRLAANPSSVLLDCTKPYMTGGSRSTAGVSSCPRVRACHPLLCVCVHVY